jgi:hypothetical protein
MKRMVIAAVIGSLSSCGGNDGAAPTPPPMPCEHRGFLQRDHHRVVDLFCEFAVRDAHASLHCERFSEKHTIPGAAVRPMSFATT